MCDQSQLLELRYGEEVFSFCISMHWKKFCESEPVEQPRQAYPTTTVGWQLEVAACFLKVSFWGEKEQEGEWM